MRRVAQCREGVRLGRVRGTRRGGILRIPQGARDHLPPRRRRRRRGVLRGPSHLPRPRLDVQDHAQGAELPVQEPGHGERVLRGGGRRDPHHGDHERGYERHGGGVQGRSVQFDSGRVRRDHSGGRGGGGGGGGPPSSRRRDHHRRRHDCGGRHHGGGDHGGRGYRCCRDHGGCHHCGGDHCRRYHCRRHHGCCHRGGDNCSSSHHRR
mmetsp:Transcript_27300/g.65620  ORF Transcript_27300/g.65620 Transcript_27300/m.65620 type:complete len:208 (+) Transcript_27300:495-1118(+)